MIFDDRLLTALPFYDDRGKQAFRQEKCFRNLHTWQQLTDLRHLPPFQVITDCTTTLCSGSTWELYDVTDTLASDLSDYDFCDMLGEYTGNDKDGDSKKWFIYDGDDFCADLPSGLHYIKATIDTCIYYSEVFNICVPKLATYTSSSQLLTSWVNVSFDTFTTDGGTPKNITEADEVLASDAVAITNEFCGETGDVFDYGLQFGVGWVDNNVYAYLADPLDLGTPLSNTVTMAAPNLYQGIFTTTATGDGVYVMVLRTLDACNNMTLTPGILKRIYDIDYSNNIVLDYGHSCDMDNIVYQYGFENKVVFANKVDLVKPTYETVKTGESREGYFFVNNVVDKKIYKMVFYAPEYVGDFMSTLPMNDTITLKDKNGDSVSVDEVNVTITPTSNCFFRFDCEFVTSPINSSNCCTDLTLT